MNENERPADSNSSAPETPLNHPGQAPLESWKEIAAYLKRDVRTVRRWEKEEGLPIHRLMHLSRASVYAYASELDAWRAARRPAAEAQSWLWARPVRLPAFAMTMLLALLTAGGGLIHPPSTAAQGQGITARQLWHCTLRVSVAQPRCSSGVSRRARTRSSSSIAPVEAFTA